MSIPLIDCERSLVGSVMVSPQRMAEAVSAGVRAEWFTSDAWSLMWSALAESWRRGAIEGVSPISLRADAQRLASAKGERRSADDLTMEAIERAIDAAAPIGLDATIRLMRNGYIERQTKSAAAETLREIEKFLDAADGVVALRTRLDEILEDRISAKKISPRAVYAEIMAEYEEAYKMRVAADGPRDLKWTPGLKMPWPRMTEFMNGLRPGLHVVAARPSVGKTAFAVNLMRYWCEHDRAVLFCSLDMPCTEVMRRFLAERARVSARKAAFSPTSADLDALRKAQEALASWPLSVVETRDVDDLRTLCMVERAARRLDVVVVDYLQLLHARSLGREDAVEYSRVSYVSDTLKRLANELRVPVVALAQLNRESTKQDAAGRLPGLADLRGSGAIEQDAFTVAILHRDAAVVEKWKSGVGCDKVKRLIPGTLDNPAYRYNLDDLDPIWWILCKAQNGPTGKLPFVVRKKYFAWMLGDDTADAIETTTGYGSTQRKVLDNSPKFERVHADWRHDPIEELLRLQFALIESAEEVQNEETEAK